MNWLSSLFSPTIKDVDGGGGGQKPHSNSLYLPACGDGEEEEEMILVTANTEIVPIYEDDELGEETILLGGGEGQEVSRMGSHLVAAANGSGTNSVVPELELTPR